MRLRKLECSGMSSNLAPSSDFRDKYNSPLSINPSFLVITVEFIGVAKMFWGKHYCPTVPFGDSFHILPKGKTQLAKIEAYQ